MRLYTHDELSSMSLKALRDIARVLGITGYSRWKSDDKSRAISEIMTTYDHEEDLTEAMDVVADVVAADVDVGHDGAVSDAVNAILVMDAHELRELGSTIQVTFPADTSVDEMRNYLLRIVAREPNLGSQPLVVNECRQRIAELLSLLPRIGVDVRAEILQPLAVFFPRLQAEIPEMEITPPEEIAVVEEHPSLPPSPFPMTLDWAAWKKSYGVEEEDQDVNVLPEVIGEYIPAENVFDVEQLEETIHSMSDTAAASEEIKYENVSEIVRCLVMIG